mmetsp:Transcript_9616/g.12468  ORF Transcript_9616/g.12468 Transcript_9616/m.12468 type:complete len:243 (-) Transcript_9616:131-859(-)|eukprot:CAMPEP_0116070028 /NCGR_PEP_ID=MMETSP0322-20121206/12728_1 /TAXON_ID=163516 /ORGANISM="Leptocylindrus danicus var. apora, Strain B651" /LENGTH=242 /DNA_ID=CAMNT_0003557683 /DNA_START=278 /DNA_END=1006 /DNA_ORIENTATION=-
MPPTKRKRSTNSNSSSKKKSNKSSHTSEMRRGYASKSNANILQMFAEFANDPNNVKFSMDMEGICALCEKIGMDPESDVRILVLLWKLGANARPGEISKEEFVKGCESLGLDTPQKIKDYLPALELGFMDRDDFKGFYKFCFQFHREGTHRTLDSGLVVALLNMVLGQGRVDADRLKTFCTYLETKCGPETSNSRITLDQWSSFLDFCYEVDDLADYDEDGGAWPVLLDEYVEWMLSDEMKN